VEESVERSEQVECVMKKISETMLKSLFAALLAVVIAGGSAAIVDAKRGYSKSASRLISKGGMVKPSKGSSSFFEIIGGSAAGTIVGEVVHDALKSDEEHYESPLNNRPQMQKLKNDSRGCGCQGN
jgi:hypothetical protein